MEPTGTLLQQAQTLITDFAAEYTPAVLVILGAAIVIGLGIWGFKKLLGLFRSNAK